MKAGKLTLLLSLVCTMAMAAPEFGMVVGTDSVKVAPERGTMNATAWTNGIATAQGQLFKYSGLYFMAETAEASSTALPMTNSLMRALSGNKQRSSLVLCNASTNTVWLNIGGAARTDAGARLSPGWSIVLDDIQAPVFAISTADSLLTGVDVPKP